MLRNYVNTINLDQTLNPVFLMSSMIFIFVTISMCSIYVVSSSVLYMLYLSTSNFSFFLFSSLHFSEPSLARLMSNWTKYIFFKMNVCSMYALGVRKLSELLYCPILYTGSNVLSGKWRGYNGTLPWYTRGASKIVHYVLVHPKTQQIVVRWKCLDGALQMVQKICYYAH